MTEAGDGAHEELSLEVISQTEGYMYIYTVPNSNGIRERFDPVWENGIDDITITQTHSQILAVYDYYPFGMAWNNPLNQLDVPVNKYLYQGKEWETDLDLNTYDFNARMYMLYLGRTFQLDPLAEVYYSFSPYSWVANNPLLFTDPTGMWIDWSVLQGKENRENRREYRKAFREIKNSGETGKAAVKFLKSKESRKIQLTAN
ncbi:MAG: hypothetical protein JJU28_22840 [Cyclobacteriaceae bacterium]|nr:hypothetical protein [Cyclobacteriaceae bacterium]